MSTYAGISGWQSNNYSVYLNGEKIEDLVIPDDVTTVYPMFRGCKTLKSVHFSKSVVIIGENAFRGCTNIEAFYWPSDSACEQIGRYAFYQCYNLTNLVLPDGLIRIWEYAIGLCTHLQSLSIPSSVTTIDAKAITDNNVMLNVYIYTTNISIKVTSSSLSWFYNANANTVLHIPSSVTSPETTYGSYWNKSYHAGGWTDTLSYVTDL